MSPPVLVLLPTYLSALPVRLLLREKKTERYMICPRPTSEGTDGPKARSSSSQSQQLGEDEINRLPEAYDPHRANTQSSHAYRTKSERVRNRDKRDRKRRERSIFLKVGTEFPQGESTCCGKMSSPGELSICCYQRIEMNRMNNRERKFWNS